MIGRDSLSLLSVYIRLWPVSLLTSSRIYCGESASEIIHSPNEHFVLIIRKAIPNSSRILDLACGDGTYGLVLSKKSSLLIGLDISIRRLRRAKKRIFGHCQSQCGFLAFS